MRTQKRLLYAGLLLLMLAAPMSAHAETSSEAVYVIPGNPNLKNEPVEVAPKGTAPPKGHPGPKPKTGKEAATATTTTTPAGEPESQESHEAQAAPPGDGGGNPPGGGGDPKEGASPKPVARSRIAGSTGPTQAEKRPIEVDSSAAGGGSSPVLPILIAVAVLAALSIGTVIYRGRTPQAG
jgi:hypothetical protein